MAYSEKLIDHYEHPRNVGTLDKDAQDVGTGMVGAPACGDVMRLQIRVNDEGVIEDAKFKTYGCGSAIASSSLVTEWVKGKTLDEAGALTNAQIAEELALPPVKIHCSILAEDAIKAAIDDYTRAVAFIPDLAGAYINRGDVRFLLRETEGACQDLKKACELGECDRLNRYEDAGRCRDFF